MEDITQRDWLMKEEAGLVELIEDMKREVASVEEDLTEVRKHIANLNSGLDDNAYFSYLDVVCWDTKHERDAKSGKL